MEWTVMDALAMKVLFLASFRFCYICSVKRILSLSFIFIFLLQVGIKSLVSFYFQTIAKQEAETHCIYKTLTVCKGNCFVTKQIKIFTSSPNEQNEHQPGFDLQSFKDAVCLQNPLNDIDFKLNISSHTEIRNVIMQFYFYTPLIELLRPPIVWFFLKLFTF